MSFRGLLSESVIVVSICAISCTSGSDKIIMIDTERAYPLLNLSVTDLADITYIKLQGEAHGVYVDGGTTSQVFIDENRGQILIGETRRNVHISAFDFQGRYIRGFGHEGRGPGEYMNSFRLVYDQEIGIINIFCPDKIIRYTCEGKYLEERRRTRLLAFGKYFIQGSEIVYFNDHSKYVDLFIDSSSEVKDLGRTLTVFDKQSLQEKSTPDHYYSNVWKSGKFGSIGNIVFPYGNVCYTETGHLISSMRSDTTYLFDHSRRMVPYMLDVRHNAQKEYLLTPTIASRDYIFVALSARYGKWPMDNRYYAIRRKDNQIFSCGESGFYRFAYRESFHFQAGNIALTPGYAYSFIHRYDLEEAEKLGQDLPEEVRKLSEGMTEDSNPILMLVKLRE